VALEKPGYVVIEVVLMNEAVDKAKAVIASHEEFTRTGDLAGILSNVADDIVLLAPNVPLVSGLSDFKHLYGDLIDMGIWDFTHEYAGSSVVDDVVILHGVARGTFTPSSGDPAPILNNFLLMLRQDGASFKVWRGAFGPAS
jgi:ketosteroid isomerase-like protein